MQQTLGSSLVNGFDLSLIHISPAPVGGVSAQDRLTELRALYDQRLITQEEYEEKRREILKDL